MAIELKMPALSPTMEKGTLAKWLISPGDLVKAGDMIAEIETDKATMELEADADGRLSQITIPDGSEDVKVGTVIAVLVGVDESVEARAPAADAPAVLEPAEPAEALPYPDALPGSETQKVSSPPAAAPPPTTAATGERPTFDETRATPLATRIAAMKGVDLSAISGSGPRGKIVKADLGIPASIVRAARATAPTAEAPLARTISVEPPAGVPLTREKFSSMRKTIARRLTDAKQQIPHFYLTVRCNLDPLLALRTQLNGALEGRGIKLSVNDLLIKALALALDQVPEANVQFGGDEIYRFERVDVSMAVAIEGGLITPVLRDVGRLSLAGIAAQSKALAQRARDGKLTPQDYTGGTVSISNLGMFGVDEMVPVINPPQALILGTAAGIRQPWNVDGEIKLATVMAATASFDHRVIDGAVGARFIAAFKDIVEQPLLICA
ncbi:dihydrolipoamide acetyltransferase family protein [Novosphingobium sp. 9U]|uniref:dihydrolipoamide acetyltransferase family protein n=1 Tax=Novosphingobium sp. 9U TaxID=2653158 RepID=UPI0012F3C2EF|nr:dihydrolipoamide acetyltransferase family protein [Novosphingobium sp. 9U]VWX50078.1 Dihydrolipoyllysine-residue acetyltransferase component of pyruvate dehydrogenase complex [Novosphingobium sp. 9U]